MEETLQPQPPVEQSVEPNPVLQVEPPQETGPPLRVRQSDLNDFHATLKQYPDYTFEEAVVDFPEIAEDESLWEYYQVYSNTIKSGKYNPEELNKKFIDFSGYEIEGNADVVAYDFNTAEPEATAESTDGGAAGVNLFAGSELLNKEYPDVPIVKRANFLKELSKDVEPEQPQSPSGDPKDNYFSEYFKKVEFNVSGGELGERGGEGKQASQQRFDFYRQLQHQSKQDTYADINASYDQISEQIKRDNPKLTDAEVYYQALNRKAEAIRVATQEYEIKYGQEGSMPTAPKELVEIIDDYDEALKISGATDYGKAYKSELNSYNQWLTQPAGADINAIGLSSAQEAIDMSKELSSQFSVINEQFTSLNKEIKSLRETLDVSSEESVNEFNQKIKQSDDLFYQLQSIEEQYQPLKPYIEQQALKIESLQRSYLKYEEAKKNIPEELRLKGPIAIAQYENASANFNNYILSRKGSIEDFQTRLRDIRQGVSSLESIKNIPKDEIAELDIQYANLSNLLSKSRGKISALTRSIQDLIVDIPAGYNANNVAKYIVGGEKNVPVELQQWVGKALPIYQQMANLTAQVKSAERNLDINRERFHMWSDVQRTLDDPEWKQKARLDKFNKQSFLGKAAIITNDAIAQAGYSLQKTYIAMEDLAWSSAFSMYEVLGDERAGKALNAFNNAYVDAVVGEIDANLRYLQEISPMASVEYLKEKGIESVETKTLELFAITAQAGASIATSMAGTLVSGGNPFVGGAVGFAQVFGDSFYEAQDQGLNKAEATLFASILGLAAATSDTYAFGGMMKRLQTEGRESLRRTLWRAIQDNGGKIKGLNYGAIASSHLKGMVPGLIEEPASEVWEGLVGTATEFAFSAAGTSIETVESMDEFLSQVKENAIGGLAGAVLMTIPAAFKSMVTPKFSKLVHGMVYGEDANKNEQFVRAELDRYLDSGKISLADYEKTIRRIDSIKELYVSEAIPKSITNQEALIQAIALVQERKELEESVKKYGKSLAANELDRISEIDGMLRSISISNKSVVERSILDATEAYNSEDDPYMKVAKAIYAGEDVDLAEIAKSKVEQEAIGEAGPGEKIVPSAPKGRGGKKPKQVPKFKPKKVFPKRPKPKKEQFVTPQGISVTATPQEQDSFANTPIENAPYQSGVYVNYQGVEGSLQMTEDGLPAVKTSDGEYYVIEGAIPGRTMSEIGVELVRPFDTMEAMTPTELAAIDEEQQTDASAVDADFSNNTVKVYGSDYDYVSVNVDGEGDVVSVNLRDKATGQEVTVRNKNIVYDIEAQKIRFELAQQGNQKVTASDVKVAAEQLNLKQKDEKPAKNTADGGGEGVSQVQPQGQVEAASVNQREQAEVVSPLGTTQEAKAKISEAASGVQLSESVKAPIISAIEVAFRNAESAKKFIRTTGKNVKQVIQNLTGIDMSQSQEQIDAAVDNYFNTQQPSQEDAVQEQTAGQVPVQSEAQVGEEVAQGAPSAESQVSAPQAQAKGEVEATAKALDEKKAEIERRMQEVENFVNQDFFANSELLSNHWKTKKDLFENKIKQLKSLLQKGIKTGEDLRTLTNLLNDIRGILNEGININNKTAILTNEKNIEELANSLFPLISDNVIKNYIQVMNKAMESRVGSNAVEKMLIGYSDGSGYTIDGKNVEYFLSKETLENAKNNKQINAKYDAELTALESKPATQSEVEAPQPEPPSPEKNAKKERIKKVTDRLVRANNRAVESDLDEAAPKEQVRNAKKKIPRLRELYNVARNSYGRTRPQAFVEALVMDRLIQSRARMLGIKPSELYERMVFKTDSSTLPENRVNFQMEAYQGASALFKKWDIDFLGSGEGFQAYGRGHYFSGNRPTAKGYAGGLNRVRVNVVDPYTGLEYNNMLLDDAILPNTIIEKIADFFINEYNNGNLEVSSANDPNDPEALAVLYKHNGEFYDISAGVIPPGLPEVFTFSDGTNTSYFGRYLSPRDVFNILNMSLSAIDDVPSSLQQLATNYSELINERMGGDLSIREVEKKMEKDNRSLSPIILDLYYMLDEIYDYDRVKSYHAICESIKSFGLKGPSLTIGIEEEFTDEMKQKLFEDYVAQATEVLELYKQEGDESLSFSDALSEMGISYIDLSAYLYTADIFTGIDISDNTVIPLHKTASQRLLDGIVANINERGLDKVGPQSLVSEQAAALSAELLKVYADGNIDSLEEMSDALRPRLSQFLDSVNAKLDEYGLELVLSIPRGGEPNHVYYKIIKKDSNSPAYQAFKAQYKIADVLNRSAQFKKDLESVDDYETALQKQVAEKVGSADKQNIAAYYASLISGVPKQIFGFLRGRPSPSAQRAVYAKYLNSAPSTMEVDGYNGLLEFMSEREAKDVVIGLSSVFGEVFSSSPEGNVVGNILMGGKHIPEFTQLASQSPAVSLYKSGYGVHLALEAMNMADVSKYNDVSNTDMQKSFVELSSYFTQPKSLRFASQKKTTDLYQALGFYGNSHPRSSNGNLGPYSLLMSLGAKTGNDPNDFNYVVFSNESVNARTVTKWQADNQFEPGGFSATSKVIVTAMASDPGKDPVADIVSAFVPYMTEGEKAVVLNAYKQDSWGKDTSVFFRHQFMNYLVTGTGPTAELVKIFEKFRQWMSDLIGVIYNEDVAKLPISPEMKSLFDNMMSKKPGQIKVSEKLNEKISFDIKAPVLQIGTLLSNEQFGESEVIDIDSDNRLTLEFKASGNQVVVTPMELAQLFASGYMSIKDTSLIESANKTLDKAEKKATTPSGKEPNVVKSRPTPVAPSVEKVSAPSVRKRTEDSRRAVDSNPDSAKMLTAVKDRNGLEAVYKKLFGLSDKKAKAAAVVADRILQTIAERTKMSKDEVYQMIKYRKTTARQLSQEQGVLYSEGAKYRGAMRFLPEAEAILADAEAIIYALEDPNVTTPLHELAHVYEKYLTDDEVAAIASWSKTKPGTTAFSEAFARGFERFLYDGGAPSSKIRQIYSGFKAWLKNIYGELTTDSAIGLSLNPAMRDIYKEMLREMPYQRKAPKIDNTKVAVEQVSGKRGDITFSVRAGADVIGTLAYDKTSRQWVGVSSTKAGDITDIRANTKPEVVAQMVSRHDKAIDAEYAAAGKSRPSQTPVGKGKETVVKGMPPLVQGLKIIDSANQEYEIIKEEGDLIIAKRKGSNVIKKFTKAELAKKHADGDVVFKANRKVRDAIEKVKKELEEIDKALKSKDIVAVEEPQPGPVAGDIGSRGEPYTGRMAKDLYKITKERLGSESTRHVQRLPGGRVLKVAKDAAGKIQNMAEGLEPFTPMVLESGIDYVIVEDLGSSESTTLERFRNWVSRTRPEDWMKRPEVFTKQLERYGLSGILDPQYSLLYGDITSPEQWGERDGKIQLLDAGSLVAGYSKERDFDKAEEALKSKSLESKESLNSPFLYQADPADGDWDNLPNKNRKAFRKILNMTKKLIRENGNKPEGIAQLLVDMMAEVFPDKSAMPKSVAFDTVIHALSEMGISPDFTGMDVDADSSELSEQRLDEKTVFERVLKSQHASPYLKRALNKIGQFYEVESKTLARDFAYAVIEEFGSKAAIAMVQAGKFKGATGSWIYGLAIDKASASGAKYSEVANLIDQFATHQRELGRGISVLRDIYVSSPAGLYNLLIHAMNKQNANATTQATPTATAMSGALQGATQTAAAQVANNIAAGTSTPASTAINDLLILGQKERMKALKKEAKDILDSLRGISQNLPISAPSPRIQALQNMNAFDKVVQLAGNYIKRGGVQFKIWKLNFSRGLSTIGLTLSDGDYDYIWNDTQVRTILQDTLNSGLAPLDGPIRDYMRSAKIKLANIIKLAAANRDLTIASLSRDIADSLSVDPAVANQLAVEIEAQITSASKVLQQKVVDKYMDKLRERFGVNPDMADIALKDLVNLVNNNQADPASIAQVIKFAFGAVSMSDAQADEFMMLAERVFKTRPESKNRQIVTKDLVSFVNNLHPASFAEKFWIMFYPNQLAGITTQVVNTIGNFYNSLAQASVYGLQDLRNVARMGVSYSFQDAIKGLSQQFGSAIDSAVVIMKTGIAGTGNKYADIKLALQNQKTIEDDLGYRIKPLTGLGVAPGAIQALANLYNGFMMVNQFLIKMYPTRFMNATDNAFFQGNFEKSIRRQTINEFYERGLRGRALRDAVNQVLYGTNWDIKDAAALVKSEMDSVGIPFFDKDALSTYVALKQFSSEFKNAVRAALSLDSSESIPSMASLQQMMSQDPSIAPLLTEAIIMSDPRILSMTELMTPEARSAIREYHVNMNVSESIVDRAYRQSEYLTLKNQPEGVLGVFAGFTGSAVGSIPLLRFLVPYVNVPFNIANMMLDWFPLTSIPRAYGISISSFLTDATLARYNVRPSSQAQAVAQRYGLEYDPVINSEQKTRALYSTLLTVGMGIHFIGKAMGDDEDEEGPAITGGLFNVKYQEAGKTQIPYRVKMFGEEFSYENTPLFLVFSSIGNLCDIIRARKSEINEDDSRVKNAVYNTMLALQYTMQSFTEALPIEGLQIFTEASYKSRGTESLSSIEKGYMKTSQSIIRALLTPVPLLGNNLVKQVEQMFDPKKYLDEPYDPESFIARATGHNVVNTLDDGSIVMKDYLGRDVMKLPGSRNIVSLDVAEKSDIDRYIYANHFNFIPASVDTKTFLYDDTDPNVTKLEVVALKDNKELFDYAYSKGGQIMNAYLSKYLDVIKGLGDKPLEKALVIEANKYQREYVKKGMEKAVLENKGLPLEEDVIIDIDEAFKGWGSGKMFLDGSTQFDENGSILSLLDELSNAKYSPQRISIISELKNLLGVMSGADADAKRFKEKIEKYNLNVNTENIQMQD